MLGIAVGFLWPMPALAAALGAVLVAASVLRALLTLTIQRSRDPDRWIGAFRATNVVLALALGTLASLVMLERWDAGAAVTALGTTTAIGSMALFVFAPDLRLMLAFVFALNLPICGVLLWRGGAAELSAFLAEAVFLGYCVVIGRRTSRDYRAAARAAQLLRAYSREREEDYRRIFEEAHDAILIFEPAEERVLAVNESACELYGLPRERFLGMSLKSITKDVPKGEREVVRTLEVGSFRGFETVHYRADGSEILLDINASRIQYQGRPAILSLHRDVTARRLAMEQLRESDSRYRALFTASPLPLWVCDAGSLAILDANQAAVSQYGYSREEFQSMSLDDLEAETGTAHRKKDGTVIRVETTSHDLLLQGRPARLVIAQDVTDRLLLEEQLRQSRKMEAIGRLAGGVAHDFNNLLTAILGYGHLILARLDAASGLRGPAEEILKAGERAASLTRQLLAFGRKQILAPETVDLNHLVRNVSSMLSRIIGEHVELVTDLDPRPVWVRADPNQIEQVLLNLAVNGRDAMPSGGRLTVATRAREETGGTVSLSVRDTGHGMDAETRKLIFEPFFTTKPVGQGTGLGLATVQGIVEQSGGQVEVWSEPGQGSEFRVTLPASDPPAAATPAAVPLADAPKGTETILLVEDEVQVRDFLRTVLEKHGYQVLCAASGEEALRLSESRERPIQLLLTDLVLPGMGGSDLASRLRSQRPDLRVVLMSGYIEDSQERRQLSEGQVRLLPKPFSARAVLQNVREALDGNALS